MFRQALDAYETTSSILDDYLDVVKQQPQQENSARRVAIAKLAIDQDFFDRLVAIRRLQHSYDEITTEQIQGDTAEAAKKYAELFTANAHIFAAFESDPSKADLALERGADADYVLMLVASADIARQKNMADFLIEDGGASLGGALLLAVSSPEQLAVEPLVNMFGADPTVALAKAMLQKHSMGVRQALLELGADAKRAKTLIAPDTNGMKMLLAASEANKEDEAKFLIAQGVSPTSTLIHIAKTGGSVDVMRRLIRLGADKNIALVEMIRAGHTFGEEVRLIRRLDASLDTALAIALRNGYGMKVVRVLLKHGADMQNILDSEKPANEIRRKIRSSFFGDAASARSDASLPYTSEDERIASEFEMAAARENKKDSVEDISIKLLHETVGTKTQRVVVYLLPGD